MIRFFITFIIILFAQISSAQDAKKYACAFEKTLIVGNSVSSGIREKLDLFGVYGRAPGEILTQQAAGVKPIANKADGIGSMTTGVQFIAEISPQIRSQLYTRYLLDGDLQKGIAEAQTIVAVDMFYMSAVFNECPTYSRPVGEIIKEFTNEMNQRGMTLILGTVPDEDWTKLSWLADVFLLFEPKSQCGRSKNQIFHACMTKTEKTRACLQNASSANCFEQTKICRDRAVTQKESCLKQKFSEIKSCGQEINTAIREHCRSDNQCYFVDLENIVKRLNAGEKYTLRNGRSYDFAALRPDGVDVSREGTQVIVEEVLKEMSINPPRCTRPKL